MKSGVFSYTVLALILAVLIVTLVVIAIKYLKESSLEKIRSDVYQLILKAEHYYKKGENSAKFLYVATQARNLLPRWARLFITDKLIENTIELWFRGVKDLLDDGKLNGKEK